MERRTFLARDTFAVGLIFFPRMRIGENPTAVAQNSAMNKSVFEPILHYSSLVHKNARIGTNTERCINVLQIFCLK